MPSWKEVEAQRKAREELIREQLRLAREAGVPAQPRKPRTTAPLPSFTPRNDYVRTFEQFCRQENGKLSPYPWMTTSPYK